MKQVTGPSAVRICSRSRFRPSCKVPHKGNACNLSRHSRSHSVSLFSLGGPVGRQLAIREEYPISQVRATYPAMAAERLLKLTDTGDFPSLASAPAWGQCP